MNEDLPIAYGTATPIVWDSVPLELVGMPSTSNVDPSKFPNEIFELYSVPSYANNKPEIVTGAEIRSTKQSVEIGDVLPCKIAPHLNRVWIVRELHNYRRIASSEWIVIRSKIATSDYLRYALTEPKFRSAFMATSSGVGGSLIRARPRAVAKILIPLPPLNEQRRIVEKLDRIFDRLRRVRDELSHIKKLIDRYKQAVLTAAFRGDLTADWRVRELSNSWYYDNVGNVSTKIHYGYTASSTSLDTGTKLLRITDIQNNTVNWESVPFCEISQTDELKYKLEMGDLLFARTGATVGKSFLIETEIPKAVFASYLIRIILSNSVIPKYVYYFFKSDFYWAQIRDNQVGTGQPNVNGKILSELIIPICPLEEQKEIVWRIEERFAKIDKLEQEYQKAVKLCDRLEQATSAKAFRGELVPQDPNDEPASVLLERMRSEKKTLTQPKGKSRRQK